MNISAVARPNTPTGPTRINSFESITSSDSEKTIGLYDGLERAYAAPSQKNSGTHATPEKQDAWNKLQIQIEYMYGPKSTSKESSYTDLLKHIASNNLDRDYMLNFSRIHGMYISESVLGSTK